MIIHDKSGSVKNYNSQGRRGRDAEKNRSVCADNPACSLTDLCDSVEEMCSLGVSRTAAGNIYENREQAAVLEEQLCQNQVDMCWIGDEEFPEGLKNSTAGSTPAVLFYRGNFNLLKNRCVGFTGSRKVSDSGIRITEESAGELASEGVTVVSGYANGVDITAHRAALLTGGNTVFVIVEGILKSRVKSEIRELLEEGNHLFLSQFSPNLTWSAANAMKRNGTIIGLSDAMILIESAMDGGTFQAGQQTLKSGKPLFVVDYGGGKPTAEGNDFFLKQGGVPLRGDRNGKPVLKKVYAALEKKEETDSGAPYEQMSLRLS